MNTNGERPLRVTDLVESEQQLDLFTRWLDARVAESGGSYGTDNAPWSPVPLKQARDYIAADKSRTLDMKFPTVYEEDRSIKIKDLSTAQGLDYASHRWTAEQVAQELGREEFDYNIEMKEIKTERVTLPPPPTPELPGMAPAGGGAAPAAFGRPSPEQVAATLKDEPDPAGGKRSELSGPAVAEFKHQQRQSYRVMKAMVRNMERMQETMAIMSRRLIETTTPAPTIDIALPPPAPPQTIEVHSPAVQVMVEQPKAPDVTINTPAAKPKVFEITKRDAHGLIKEMREIAQPDPGVKDGEAADGPADTH